MAIVVSDLSTLDTTDVQTQLETIRGMLESLEPDIDLNRGVLHDLLLYLSAVLATANQTNVDLVRQSNSLAAIEEDPTLADDDVLDRLASNYRTTRKEGSQATGSAVVVLTASVPTVVPFGTVFTSNGVTFTTPSVFVGRTNEDDVITDTDKLIQTSPSGIISFTISLTAEEIGDNGNISMGAQLTPDTTLTNVSSVYAAATFGGGTDEETNTELSARLLAGTSAKCLSSRSSIDGMIRAEEDFENILQTSVLGFGDQEQIRYHSILPVAFGGRMDLYVRTTELWEESVVVKTATLQSKVGPVGTWALTLTRDDAPGFYQVTKVCQEGEGAIEDGYAAILTAGFSVTVNTGEDATASTTFIPDLDTADEARFSRYSTATVTFTDTDTDASGLTNGVSTRDYDVVVRKMPLILEIQDFVAGRDVRNPASDCLVKAPVPVFLTVDITINVLRNSTEPDEDDVKQTIMDYVNGTGFTGTITAAAVSGQVHNVLPTNSYVDDITLTGSLLNPDGTTTAVGPSSGTLSIVEDAEAMISSRTVCFFCAAEDITVTLETIDAP